MKICLVINSLSSGGAERVATTLANYWAEKGWSVTLVTFAGIDQDFYSVADKVRRISLNLTCESTGTLNGLMNNLKRLNALRQALQIEQADIAIGFMPSANILSGLACLGIKTVAFGSEHVHPPASPLSQPWQGLRRLVYPRLAAISALTNESASWVRRHTGARHVSIISNPIPFPLPTGTPNINPAEVQAQLGGQRLLLAVGRLEHQKAFDILLKAFSKVQHKYPEWRLVILGEGGLKADLQAYCDELGLSKFVTLLGAVGNVGDWYGAADAYVMTSRFEGFGNTLAEALCYGLPSVAVDCKTGPKYILRHEVDGLLVPQGDQDALAAALGRLMGDAALRNQFAIRAIEARERFSVERIAGQWEALLAERNM